MNASKCNEWSQKISHISFSVTLFEKEELQRTKQTITLTLSTTLSLQTVGRLDVQALMFHCPNQRLLRSDRQLPRASKGSPKKLIYFFDWNYGIGTVNGQT